MSSLRRSSGEMYAVPQPNRTRSTYGPTLSISPSDSRADSPGSMTCVSPRARGLGGRAGRSRKSGDGTAGNLKAVAAGERGRRLAVDVDGDGGERPALPLRPQQPEDVDVVVALAVAVPVAQDALVAEPDREQRLRRHDVRRVRVRPEAVHAEHAEREPRAERLRLAVRAGAPEAPPEHRADDAPPVAGGELRQAGDARGPVVAMDDEQVELLASLAALGGLIDERARLLDAGVRAPREPPRDVRVGGELEQRRRVLGDRRAQGQRGTMQGDARAAVRHPRQPTGARGGPRRPGRPRRRALPARRRYGAVRRLAGRDRGAPARARRRRVDPRQHGALARRAAARRPADGGRGAGVPG